MQVFHHDNVGRFLVNITFSQVHPATPLSGPLPISWWSVFSIEQVTTYGQFSAKRATLTTFLN
jgi:hypothetical protein